MAAEEKRGLALEEEDQEKSREEREGGEGERGKKEGGEDRSGERGVRKVAAEKGRGREREEEGTLEEGERGEAKGAGTRESFYLILRIFCHQQQEKGRGSPAIRPKR